jgi:recombination protein RecT
MTNAVVTIAPAKPMDRFKAELGARQQMLTTLLPEGMKVEKFQAIVVTAVADNMDLLDVDRNSLIKACLQAAELGLVLNKSMAEADILKVWNNKIRKYEAQFRPRYKGLMKLALQTGEVLKIESRIVYENDEFEIIEGTSAGIVHKRKLSGRGDMIGAYCVWTLRNGESQFEVMSKEEILAIRDRSSSKTKDGKVVGPWVTDEAEMWRKTVVRRATKYMPMSPEIARAVHADNVAEGVVEADEFDGDAMDITDFGHPEPEAAEEKVSSLEEKIAKVRSAEPKKHVEIEYLDVETDSDGFQNWTGWAASAIEVLRPMSASERTAWEQVHRDLLSEAEMMEPSAASAVLKLI